MRTITIRESHLNTRKLVRAAAHEKIIITDRGQPVALLKALDGPDLVGKPFPRRDIRKNAEGRRRFDTVYFLGSRRAMMLRLKLDDQVGSSARLLNSLLFSVALGLALLLTGCKKSITEAQTDPNGPVEVVIPEHGAYTGAFMDFGDEEDDVTLETIEDFEEMVGKHQAIIASSSYWGEQNFPADNLNVIWRHGSMPLVFWSPWDKPYEEDHGPDKFSLTEILAGKWDAYIDKWADAARDFGHPMIVVFGVEMNGTWFPWSGAYYGGAQWDPESKNWKGPETFRRAYRYVVDRVRARGASNIKWMFHTNNYPYPYEIWNCAAAYYPGSDYVDWLGLSVYGQQYKDEPNPDIPSLVDWPYEEMCRLDPHKPVMIAEWATGEFPLASAPPGAMHKPAWIKQGLELFRTRYPRIKAALYWHERWQNADGSYSNLRVNSSVESLQAYRQGVAHPDWLGDLILRALPKK